MAVHEEEYRGYTIEILPDEDAECPLEAGVEIVSFHRRIASHPRERSFASPEEALHWAKGERAWAFPLYAYIHSGVRLSLHPFNDPWDSGQLGYLLLHEQVRSYHGLRTRKKAAGFAKGELEAWNEWANGEVYVVSVLDRKNNLVEAVGDVYGLDYALELGRGMVEEIRGRAA